MALSMESAVTLLHQDAATVLSLPVQNLKAEGFEFFLNGRRASRLLPTFNGRSDSVPVELKTGDLTMPDVRIKLTPAPRNCTLSSTGRSDGAFGYDGCYGRCPLVLGRSELERLHLYFATKEKVAYFTEMVRK